MTAGGEDEMVSMGLITNFGNLGPLGIPGAYQGPSKLPSDLPRYLSPSPTKLTSNLDHKLVVALTWVLYPVTSTLKKGTP